MEQIVETNIIDAMDESCSYWVLETWASSISTTTDQVTDDIASCYNQAVRRAWSVERCRWFVR